MSSAANFCVVIPVHQPAPSGSEYISLKAAADRLNHYDCYLLYPDGMATEAYTTIFPQLKLHPVKTEWLSSIERYNKTKVDLAFYRMFDRYDFMLTYELDAYIFKTDFEKTCAFEFDFIGAPFFAGYWDTKPGDPFIKGCNSGFSIRNVQSCIKVLQGVKRYKWHWRVYKFLLSRSSRLRGLINKLTGDKFDIYVSGKFGFGFADFHLNEDHVWTEIVPRLFPWFKVADSLSALKFSFEYNLADSYRLNNCQLPLGCHAWYKHREFWKEYIDMEGLS